MGIFCETMVCFSNLDDLLRHYRNEVTPHKRCSYPEACRINKIIRDDIARLSLNEFSSIHIARYRTKRLKEVSKATVRKELQILSHALDLGRKEWGLHKANILRNVRKPIEPKDGYLLQSNDGNCCTAWKYAGAKSSDHLPPVYRPRCVPL